MMFLKLLLICLVFISKCEPKLVIYLTKGNFTQTVLSKVTANAGDSFSLLCENIGTDAEIGQNLLWSTFRSDGNDQAMTQVPLLLSEPSKLSFQPIQLPDAGRYLCSDKNLEQLKSVNVEVDPADTSGGVRQPVNSMTGYASFINGSEIEGEPSKEIEGLFIFVNKNGERELAPVTVTEIEGNDLSLSCLMKSENNTIERNVDWKKLEITEKPDSSKVFIKKSLNFTTSSKLEFRPIKLEDEGRYICSKENSDLFDMVNVKVVPYVGVFAGPVPPSENHPSDSEGAKLVNELLTGLGEVVDKLQDMLKKLRSIAA